MKKDYKVTYEENGIKKRTHIIAEDETAAFFFVINPDRWILEIKEINRK